MRLCSFHDGDVVRVGILFEGKVFTIEEISIEVYSVYSCAAVIRG